MATDTVERRRTYTVEEFAKAAGLGRSLVYRFAKDNALPVPTVRVGARILIPRLAADRWLNGEVHPLGQPKPAA